MVHRHVAPSNDVRTIYKVRREHNACPLVFKRPDAAPQDQDFLEKGRRLALTDSVPPPPNPPNPPLITRAGSSAAEAADEQRRALLGLAGWFVPNVTCVV
jgi:hypothetical protein